MTRDGRAAAGSDDDDDATRNGNPTELDALRLELSVRECTDELREYAASLEPNAKLAEPYKVIIKALSARLKATERWANSVLPSDAAASAGWAGRVDSLGNPLPTSPGAYPRAKDQLHAPLFEVTELSGPLCAMHRSLCACGHEELADGRLVDLIRRVAAFGLQVRPSLRRRRNR